MHICISVSLVAIYLYLLMYPFYLQLLRYLFTQLAMVLNGLVINSVQSPVSDVMHTNSWILHGIGRSKASHLEAGQKKVTQRQVKGRSEIVSDELSFSRQPKIYCCI